MSSLPSEPSSFYDIFYTVNQNWQMPGSTEAIFRGPSDENRRALTLEYLVKYLVLRLTTVVPHDNVDSPAYS